MGQTCYFNAALQCIAYCPNLANYLMSALAENDVCTKRKGASSLALALIDFVKSYWTRDAAHVQPVFDVFSKVCKGFGQDQQHDAHEAIICLLDKTHDGLSRLKPPPAHAVQHCPHIHRKPWVDGLKGSCSVVSEVFRGQVEVCVQAPGYTGLSYDHFTCLSLAISECSTLAQCFQKHLSTETITDFKVDDATVPCATLTKRFTYLPRILIVHLKRFDGNEKIDRFIDYPSELDLGQFAASPCEHHYQLFGVCLHRGNLEDGHYTACCEVKGRWNLMDDEAVSVLTNINDIIQRDAYVLMYKRL